MLAIGRNTIPAQSQLDLEPGTNFLVRVEQRAGEIVLQLLSEPEEDDAALLVALRKVIGDVRPLGERLAALVGALRDGAPELPAELRARLARFSAFAVGPAVTAEGLRALLSALGLGHEHVLARLLSTRAGPEVWERLRRDLKAELLAARGALARAGGSAELASAVTSLLEGLEAEQLLNLARARAGEAELLSVPIADAGAWATARLLVPPRRERAGEERLGDPPPYRLTLGLELSHLGPVRADLVLYPGRLSIRIAAAQPATLERLRAALPRWSERLSAGGRAVEVELTSCTPGEADLAAQPLDIRYLREHNLMNVSG
jgi:hypothetical protein